jgi:hypothetical protein
MTFLPLLSTFYIFHIFNTFHGFHGTSDKDTNEWDDTSTRLLAKAGWLPRKPWDRNEKAESYTIYSRKATYVHVTSLAQEWCTDCSLLEKSGPL